MSRILLPITTYIQEDALKKEYLQGLQQRRVDEKFSYIGERQADSWFNLCKSPDYTYYRNSMSLLKSCIEDFVSDCKSDVNVIALGPGDALKEKIVVNALVGKHRVSLFFVDISREVLDVAIKNTEDSDVLKEVFIADLKKFTDIKALSRLIKKRYNPTNFFTLLGNTIGNYPQAMIFTTFRDAMEPGDKLLIDVNVKTNGSVEKEAEQIDEILRGYNKPIYMEQILASLSEAGIEKSDGEIETEFGRDEFFPQISVAKQYFCFSRSRTINYQGTDIYFSKGERILVHYSNKYTFESLKHMLTSHGFHLIKYIKDTTGKYYQLLCELA